MVSRSSTHNSFKVPKYCFTQQQWLASRKRKSNMVKTNMAWMNVMKGHAVTNGVYVAATNRIGLENIYRTPGIEFWELHLSWATR
jgi:predicted amidohydrolase